MDAVINEALRIMPPVPRIERRAATDCFLGKNNELFIEKGTLIIIPVHAIQRDADNYYKPDEFLPERFLPENSDKLNHNAFLPFADGPRNCIGARFAIMEIKILLFKLFRRYKFEVVENISVNSVNQLF